jgi:TM2 domain-containing membrane protein YozV
MNDQAVVCVSCGVPVGKGNNFCPACGGETNPEAQICIKCGVDITSIGTQKSKLVAGLLGIFLGCIGVHRFYLGYTTIGVLQIVATLLTCGIASLWGFIEGILILAGSAITKDAHGNPLKD